MHSTRLDFMRAERNHAKYHSPASILKGGETGPAMKSGDPQASLLWKKLAADEMPKGAAKLSAQEKRQLLNNTKTTR